MADILSLQYSQAFDIQGMEEANVDLQLPSVSLATAAVSGVVIDGVNPIADATVKLFDSAGMPYQHTLTDAAGTFALSGIPAGSYTLAAVKEGYRLSDAVSITLTEGASVQVELVCTADATLHLGAIAGVLTVRDQGTVTPLGGAVVTLQDSLGAVIGSTCTADDGEFLFYDLADGIYTLTSAANGYLATSIVTTTIVGGSISNVTLSMTVDTRTYYGTVSGIIRDTAGQAVAGCFVGLYQVVTALGVTTETLVATTKTNTEGKYLFGGVMAGQYVVKAKLEQ